MGSQAVIGWHGKLPSLGDFATRRLAPDLVSLWDGWLSAGLARLQQAPDWPQAYLASPSWRFLLLPGALPGALGLQSWAGVLMPSVDRVGRYYPLTLAQPLPGLPADGPGVQALWTWLLQLDEAAADALHEDWTVEQLEAELQRLGQPAYRPVAPVADGPLLDPQALVQALVPGDAPHTAALLQAQAAGLWQQQMHGRSVWSAQPERGAARHLCAQGLGGDELLPCLLGGRAAPSSTIGADNAFR
ncbi:MAG: type VI secretion system-associated protein TagF [Pseudomonadota bacterium]